MESVEFLVRFIQKLKLWNSIKKYTCNNFMFDLYICMASSFGYQNLITRNSISQKSELIFKSYTRHERKRSTKNVNGKFFATQRSLFAITLSHTIVRKKRSSFGISFSVCMV